MKMVKMKASFLFTVVTLAVIVSVNYGLTLLDNIVHVSLYSYGLRFSQDWAEPYWMTLHMVQVLLALVAGVTVLNAVYLYRAQLAIEPKLSRIPRAQRVESEPRMPRIELETKAPRNEPDLRKPNIETIKKPEVRPTVTPTMTEKPNPPAQTIEQQLSGVPPGMVRCGHCGKIFAQPLRMLDFHEDRPRMISICPFCNELIQTAPRPS